LKFNFIVKLVCLTEVKNLQNTSSYFYMENEHYNEISSNGYSTSCNDTEPKMQYQESNGNTFSASDNEDDVSEQNEMVSG